MYIFLGKKVKTSLHKDATVYIVKRIDSDKDKVFIVPIDGSFNGQWYSSNALYEVQK